MINYESPLYVSIVLYTIYALLLLAAALTGWSVVRSLRLQGKEGGRLHGVPARRITLITLALVVATMAVTWMLGSTKPLMNNGKTFADAFWLKTSDMFIITPIVLIAVLCLASLFSVLKKK